MKRILANAWVVILLWAAAPAAAQQAYLYPHSFDIDTQPTEKAEVYQPQAGDIFLATDNLLFNRIGHWLAGSGAPHHSGLVVALPDGGFGVLESGPHNTMHVGISRDIVGHFASHEKKGERVWIR